uniref:Uncharacterized protein n=1 Tax=Nelumbo nucifera TaxID=4432 RepID=A0A822XEA7_NELNU|nr:TPA_asm: hypothetical protein HUJ06_021247 [Nelumbo nucifera]
MSKLSKNFKLIGEKVGRFSFADVAKRRGGSVNYKGRMGDSEPNQVRPGSFLKVLAGPRDCLSDHVGRGLSRVTLDRKNGLASSPPKPVRAGFDQTLKIGSRRQLWWSARSEEVLQGAEHSVSGWRTPRSAQASAFAGKEAVFDRVACGVEGVDEEDESVGSTSLDSVREEIWKLEEVEDTLYLGLLFSEEAGNEVLGEKPLTVGEEEVKLADCKQVRGEGNLLSKTEAPLPNQFARQDVCKEGIEASQWQNRNASARNKQLGTESSPCDLQQRGNLSAQFHLEGLGHTHKPIQGVPDSTLKPCNPPWLQQKSGWWKNCTLQGILKS